MSELILNCPQCQRQLRVPGELLGKKVKCPTCEVVFTAEAPKEELPAAAPGESEQARPLPPSTGAEYREAPAGPRPSSKEEYYDEGDDERRSFGRSFRRDLVPHRGGLILTLGILSLVICGFLGPFAWVMGNNDLAEMRAGRMNREGEGLTQAGRICGIIATVLLLISCTCGGLMFLLQAGRGFR